MYNLRDKGFAKVLARVLECPLKDIITDLEKGDMPETAKKVAILLTIVSKTSYSSFNKAENQRNGAH